ncbi:FKBP-type peptidyl-prolyl cis-trans isomerase [Olivibacter jilunii]|uniref:FKBP-type peptidyl-prolyl cis-trans isomerase n=1 Tax=Olivibacter jilunii TaxID=985016 RepID=UPI003F5CE8A5
MIKPLIIAGLVAVSALPTFAQQKTKQKIIPKQNKVTPMFESKIDSASYAFGLSMARDLKKRGLKNLNGKLVAQAIEDYFSESPIRIKEEDEYKAISDVLTAAAEDLKKEQTAAGNSFLAQNKTKAGVHTTTSGLQYEIIRDAVGPKPLATDSVTVNYKGALLSGKVFDSSYDRGEPISFQLNRVIQGWQEGLQLMPVGSHYRFYIPYQLGYGERGAGNDIPPFSVLVFDVELLKIGG